MAALQPLQILTSGITKGNTIIDRMILSKILEHFESIDKALPKSLEQPTASKEGSLKTKCHEIWTP